MAGHSHWAGIKHKKGRADKERSKIFSKLSKEITVAAKLGDKDPDMNPRLRTAIQAAKQANMPKENISRAISKSEMSGDKNYENLRYEGFGPANTAFIIETLTDNKNRSASEVRHTFNKAGANMAEQGAVSRMFQRKGQIFIEKEGVGEEELMECVLESGAEDLKTEGAQYEVLSDPGDYDALSDALIKADITMASSEIVMIPDLITEVTDIDQARSILKFIDALEELDDVQDVYANFDEQNTDSTTKDSDFKQDATKMALNATNDASEDAEPKERGDTGSIEQKDDADLQMAKDLQGKLDADAARVLSDADAAQALRNEEYIIDNTFDELAWM